MIVALLKILGVLMLIGLIVIIGFVLSIFYKLRYKGGNSNRPMFGGTGGRGTAFDASGFGRRPERCPSCSESIMVGTQPGNCPRCGTPLGRNREGKLLIRVN